MDGDHRGHRQIPFAEPHGPGILADDVQRLQHPVHRAVERVEHPLPADRAERDRRDPRQQDQEPKDRLAEKGLRETRGEDLAEHEHQRLRHHREDERVAERLHEGRALERAPDVVEADECVGAAGDLRVAERQVDRQAERKADERQHVQHGRQDHDRTEEALSVEQGTLGPPTCRGPAGRGLSESGVRWGCYLFHFAKMRFMSASACLAESSADCSPLATRANMSGTTNVLNTSSIAAVVWPG